MSGLEWFMCSCAISGIIALLVFFQTLILSSGTLEKRELTRGVPISGAYRFAKALASQ